MTVSSLIERLKILRTHQNTPEKSAGVFEKKGTVIGEIPPNTPNTPNTPEKVEVQTGSTESVPVTLIAPVAVPERVPVVETWRHHDKADQAHYWSCDQCRAVVVQRQPGNRCSDGKRLNDAYIDAAHREGRFIGYRQ